MSKFEFVNHSCIILSHNNVSLAMDPWIEGSVFNNSWDLLTKTPEKSIESLKKSKFVWFSHEHPDHFNPPNLKIFSDKNNFLFQKTVDNRVVKFFKQNITKCKRNRF
jgi:L-ascorbate metabolism protein UlaG (beta-lactamase superfamily)